METKPLGNSDLSLTPLVNWRLGYGWRGLEPSSWGAQGRRPTPFASIREALDRGMNWIDTAAALRLQLRPFRGRWLPRHSKAFQNAPMFFTKCERIWNEQRQIQKSLKRDSILREAEASFRAASKLT